MALFTKKIKEEKSPTGVQARGVILRSVLLRPHTTEKSLRNAIHRQYTFVMRAHVSKQEAAKEIEALYGVHVIDSTVTVRMGTKPHFRGVLGSSTRTKKITVTLAPGEHIDITGTS